MRLLGRELTISREKEEAAVITGLFSRVGSDNAYFFIERFKDEFVSLDDAISGVTALSEPFFDTAVKRAVDLLEEHGISSFNNESLTAYLKNNGFFSIWDDSLQRFIEKKNSIELEIQTAGEDRHAAGDAAKAQVFDLMEGYLEKAMRYTISGFASAIMGIIAGETGLALSAPTREEVAESKEIYDKAISGKTPEKDRVDAMFEAIALNPNNADAFYFLVLRFGDSDCEIEKAGEYFGNPIGQMKLDKIAAYQKKALRQQLAAFAGMEDDEYIKALESLKEGFANIRHNMGISHDLKTQSEKNIDEAIRLCRDGARIRGAEADILCFEKGKKQVAKKPVKTEPVQPAPMPESGDAPEPKAEPEQKSGLEPEQKPESEVQPEPETKPEPEAVVEPGLVHKTRGGRSKLTISRNERLLPEDKLSAIRDLCSRFKAEAAIPGLYEPTRKLIHYLELEDGEEIFLGQDKTILGSGKDGFAITSVGIICVSGKEACETPYRELAAVKKLHWANPDFRFDIMADGSTLLKCLPSEKDDILELVTSIREVVRS